MNVPSDTVWMLDGAERCYDEPAAVWEAELDGLDDPGPWVVHEYERQPGSHDVPRAASIVDRLTDNLADDLASEGAYVDEVLGDGWHERVAADPEVIAAAEALRAAVGKHATWHSCGRLIGTHRLELVDDEPAFDGAPLYRSRSEVGA